MLIQHRLMGCTCCQPERLARGRVWSWLWMLPHYGPWTPSLHHGRSRCLPVSFPWEVQQNTHFVTRYSEVSCSPWQTFNINIKTSPVPFSVRGRWALGKVKKKSTWVKPLRQKGHTHVHKVLYTVCTLWIKTPAYSVNSGYSSPNSKRINILVLTWKPQDPDT